MTEHYEQKVKVNPSKNQIIYKRLSFLFGMLTIVFAIPAGLYHLAFLSGTILNLILAIVFNQLYLSGVCQYIVEINRARYTVSKTNRFGKTEKIHDEILDNVLDVKIIKASEINENIDDSTNILKCYDESSISESNELTIIKHNNITVILPLDLYAQELLQENIRLRNNK